MSKSLEDMTAAQLFDMVAKGTAMLSQQCYSKTRNGPDAVYVGIGAVIGALTSLALVIGENPGDQTDSDFDPGKRVNADTILFGALLAIESTTVCGSRKLDSNTSATEHEVEFSPVIIMAALDSFEKFTGRRPDAKLCPQMVQAARMGADAGAVLLSELLKKRPMAPSTDTPQ